MFSQSKQSKVGDQRSSQKQDEWELRPGGMLVQKRNSNSNENQNQNPVSDSIKIKVKYGSTYHEIRINSQASFGELKKMLAEVSGLHSQDQKIIFKKKERDSKSYLDQVKVKDGSKMELVVDIESRERRTLEMLKLSNKSKISKSLSQIKLDIGKYSNEVSAMEASACEDNIMEESDVAKLIDNLMRIFVKLDEIVGTEGDLKLERKQHITRVQKQIEILDKLKETSNSRKLEKQKQPLKSSESFIVTTKWETFD